MIYLASRSPRRRLLLEQIGVRHRTLAVDVPETWRAGEPPETYVRRVAREKAIHGRAHPGAGEALPVLAADTAVVLDGEVLGKPRDADEASRMLRRLSGRQHVVLSAVVLTGAGREAALRERLSRTRVWFRDLDERECAAYCASGEPLDKAGAYAIQGLAAAFVRRIDGSYSGVMGLPLFETAQLLGEVGIEVVGGC